MYTAYDYVRILWFYITAGVRQNINTAMVEWVCSHILISIMFLNKTKWSMMHFLYDNYHDFDPFIISSVEHGASAGPENGPRKPGARLSYKRIRGWCIKSKRLSRSPYWQERSEVKIK